jgi:hypothetical protein
MKRKYTAPAITTYGDIRELTKGRPRWGDGDGIVFTIPHGKHTHTLELPLQS